MIVAEKFTNTTNSPSVARARVELYNGSALLNIYGEDDYLQSFNVERIGEESKFFGFGVCHKITVILADYEGNVNLTDANTLEVAYGVGSDFLYTYPYFKIAEITKDEAKKEIIVTAYDALRAAAEHTAAELELPEGERTIMDYAVACARVLGLPLKLAGVQDNSFDLVCAPYANLEGTESVREVLNDIAEATQTIYYINNNWELVFKRLDKDGAAVAKITADNSMNIIVGDTHALTGITHATELGDNVNATTGEEGVTQYVHDNAFWELRDDIADILDASLSNLVSGAPPAQLGVARLGTARLGAGQQGDGMKNTVFSADWFGNYLLEVGDKLEIETDGGTVIYSYVLNDVIAYTGIVLEQSQWIYTKSDGEHKNSNKLGEALKQTFARVDKVNKQIDIVASETAENKENIAQLQLTTEQIAASVVESTNELKQSVEAKMSAEDVTIAIKQGIADGVNKVETATGYKFDADGMTVSKSGSEMSTQITEDGMKVFRDSTEVLTANNEGVRATNLRATTYLIIGKNSRIEDYNRTRTACFWIGG